MLSETSAVVKPLLLVKRRRSFGGANGVWWRQRTSNRSTRKTGTDDTSTQSSPPESSSKNDADSLKQSSSSTNTETEIEWDEDLCRPIYRSTAKSLPENSDGSIVSDGNESSSSSPTPSSPTNSHQLSPNKVDSISKRLWIKAPIKRNKSFGTRKRPYTCLLLQESSSSLMTTASEDVDENHSTASSTTLSVSSQANASVNVKADAKAEANNNKKRRILQNDEATLQKAKQFFEQLDATQSLNVDRSQSSPLSSSKITRTSHKMNLTSPRIQREYQAYAKASRESEVTPWSIRTYASSRRDFFRKRELFDGFLDD